MARNQRTEKVFPRDACHGDRFLNQICWGTPNPCRALFVAGQGSRNGCQGGRDVENGPESTPDVGEQVPFGLGIYDKNLLVVHTQAPVKARDSRVVVNCC